MKKQYAFHLLGLVHLPTSREYMSCAFTQKNIKIARMLAQLGHKVYLYGAKGDYIPHSNIEFVETHTIDDIRADYGEGDNRFEIGYNWQNKDFKHDFNAKRNPSTLKYYGNAILQITKRKKPDDFLLLSQGHYQKPISDALKMYLTVEHGIGYRGSFANFRAFESHYLQYFTYGSEHPYKSIDGNYYDRVIPNYFHPADIEFSPEKEDYYLYIGRMIKRKGILTAWKTAHAVGKKLIIAGQGAKVLPNGSLVATQDTDFEITKGNWEYVGYQDIEKRKKLMARAKVVLVPTEYLEAFAGVHIEAMLSGTPVLTTNFGVFTDTVIDGVNGFKCNNLQEFAEGAKKCEDLNPWKVQQSAQRYLVHNVGQMYQRWFDDLHNLWESSVDPAKKGWHRLSPEFHEL